MALSEDEIETWRRHNGGPRIVHRYAGGELNENRQALVDEMVTVSGPRVLVKAPINPRLQRESTARLYVPEDAESVCKDLRRVLYDLLTAVADDVQDRYHVSPGGMRDKRDPDAIIGCDLPGALKAKKTSDSIEASADLGTD